MKKPSFPLIFVIFAKNLNDAINNTLSGTPAPDHVG